MNMVSQKEKNRMMGFILSRLESSKLYQILELDATHLVVREKKEVREVPKKIYVLGHNFKRTLDELDRVHLVNRENGTYTAHVFYKDGEISFVRMVDKNLSWRSEESLKQYNKQKINEMLSLRGIEKKVIESDGNILVYYQPTTDRLRESLRVFRLHPVELDYSHLRPGDPGYGFARDCTSIDYKLPKELNTVEPAARFGFHGSQPDISLRARIMACESPAPYPPRNN